MVYIVLRFKQTRVQNLVMLLLVMSPRMYLLAQDSLFSYLKGVYLYFLCKDVSCGRLNVEMLTELLA